MRSLSKMLTFTEWKALQIKRDSDNSKADISMRPREWYYDAYGKYCNKYREIFKDK